MFDQDRFGPEQDYFETYRVDGGTRLSPDEVTAAVNELVDRMTTIGDTPERYDSFPSVRSVLGELKTTKNWPVSELERIENTVALHELGQIPSEYANVIRGLAQSHRLGLVSNLWSTRVPWLEELARAGLLETFVWLVFSSDGRSIKPSTRIFESILGQWKGERVRVLMVGDSLKRDVAGAHAVGIKAMWIYGDNDSPATNVTPEFQVKSLLELGSSTLGA